MKKTILLTVFLTILAIASSTYFYPAMPTQMASHWNSNGDVNGFLDKNIMLFLTPVILLIVTATFALIPKIDPLKSNIDKFKGYYYGFILLISLFLFGMHVFTIAWNLGYQINPNTFMPVTIGILFFYIGVMLEHSQQNWFIGIRTPWTISNELVWNKTHRLGAILFKLSGILSIIGTFAGNLAMYFVLVPILISTVTLVTYSYIEYKKLEKQNSNKS